MAVDSTHLIYMHKISVSLCRAISYKTMIPR